LRDVQEAEDAVQETMELAWRSWSTLRDPLKRRVAPPDLCTASASAAATGSSTALVGGPQGCRSGRPAAVRSRPRSKLPAADAPAASCHRSALRVRLHH